MTNNKRSAPAQPKTQVDSGGKHRRPVQVPGRVHARMKLLLSLMGGGTAQAFVGQAVDDRVNKILEQHDEWAQVFRAAGL